MSIDVNMAEKRAQGRRTKEEKYVEKSAIQMHKKWLAV